MDLDEGDAFDEISATSSRQTTDEEFEATGKSAPKPVAKDPYGTPCPCSHHPNSTVRRYHLTDESNIHTDPGDERDLVRKFQAGDKLAGDRLVRGRIAWLKDIIGKQYGSSGVPFDYLVSAAADGLSKAYRRYNLGSNKGLTAFALKRVNGAICDAITDYHYRGHKNESREARKERAEHRPIHAQLNDSGERDSCDGWRTSNAGWIAADDHELHEHDGSAGKVTDAAWHRIVAGRAVPTNYPNWWEPETPCKPISRERYEEDQAQAHRFDTAAHAQQRLSHSLAKIGRKFGVPRECWLVDGDPRTNGGRDRGKARFPTRDIFSETAKLQLKNGRQRTVVRQKAAGTLGKYASATGIPRAETRCDNPLPAPKCCYIGSRNYKAENPYLVKTPTPEKHQINAATRGNAPPLGIIGYLAQQTDLRAKQRLKQVGRVQYAQELAAKDRAAIVPLFSASVRSNGPSMNTSAAPEAAKLTPPLVWLGQDKWGPPPDWKDKDHVTKPPTLIWDQRYPKVSPFWKRIDASNNPQLRIIEGMQNGKFNHPGTINHAVHGRALHQPNRGSAGDVRKVNRAGN
jgi:hypothetical protein